MLDAQAVHTRMVRDEIMLAAGPIPGPRTRTVGFEPIETYTGFFWVAHLWPDQHRRSVIETRPAWLDDPHHDGRLWLVRSPWPGFIIEDSLNVLWTWVERDHSALTEDLWTHRVTEALSWDGATAAEWHRRSQR